MLERAKRVTQTGRWNRLEYARYADDLVILIDAHPRWHWLLAKVRQRLEEELAKPPSGSQRGEEPSGRFSTGRNIRFPGVYFCFYAIDPAENLG